jgi:hypothetical protein
MSKASDQMAEGVIAERRVENERCFDLERQREDMWQDLLCRPVQPTEQQP